MGIFVKPNQTGEERIGTVKVAGTIVEIRQYATNAGICGRTPAVVLEIAADQPCDRVSDQHLSQITELVVGKKGLNTLKAGDFAGLSSVEWLDLTGNDLTELPEEMFSELSKLKYLVLLSIAPPSLERSPNLGRSGVSILPKMI